MPLQASQIKQVMPKIGMIFRYNLLTLVRPIMNARNKDEMMSI